MARGSEARAADPKEVEKLKAKVEGRPEQVTTPEAGPESHVGEVVETKAADGSALELTVVGETGGEQVLNSPEGTTVRPEGQAERRERSLMTVADIISTYDSLAETLIGANTDEADKPKYERAIAGRKAMSVLKAAGSETPNDVVQAELSAVFDMSDEELALAQRTPTLSELKVAAREAEMDLSEAQDINERARADARLVSAALEIKAREQELRMEAREKKAVSDAEAAARAEGFIDISYSEIYEGGADAVTARIAEIEGEIENLRAIPESKRREAVEIRLEALYNERQKHRAVLPLLEGMKQLKEALTDIDTRENKEIEKQKAEAAAELTKIERSKWSYGMHMAKLKKFISDPTGWVAHYTREIFGRDDEDEDLVDEEQQQAMGKFELFKGKIDNLTAQAEKIQDTEIDFSLDGEREAANKELHDYLLNLARDGQVDAVKEFIAFQLGRENTSAAERAALEQTLDDIEDPKHELFAKGMRVDVQPFKNAPDVKIKGTIVGFTLKGRVRVRIEKNGLVMNWDDERVTDIGTPEYRKEMGTFEKGGRVMIELDGGHQTGTVVGVRENGLVEVQGKDGEIGVYDPEVITNLVEAQITEHEYEEPFTGEKHRMFRTVVSGIDMNAGREPGLNDYFFNLPGIDTSSDRAKEVGIYTESILLDQTPETARRVMEFAAEAARDAEDVYDLYEKVREFADANREQEAGGNTMQINEGQREFIHAKRDQYQRRLDTMANSARYQAPESPFWEGYADSIAKAELANALLESGSTDKASVRARVREQVPGPDARVDYYVDNAWNVIDAYNRGDLSDIVGMESIEPAHEPEIITDVEDESGEQVGPNAEAATSETMDVPADWGWRWDDIGVPEAVTATPDVIAATAKELGVSEDELDGLKATYELIRDNLRLSQLNGGSNISMEALGLPDSWNDFLALGKKADRGFFKKLFGGKSDTQKALGKLAEAFPAIVGGAEFRAPSEAEKRIRDLRRRMEKVPNHVFNVKIG